MDGNALPGEGRGFAPHDMTEPQTDGTEIAPEEAPDEVAALKRQLAEAEAKAAENWDKALRAAAELDNVRRRVERESATLQKYALERILGDLIAVNDSLELALQATQDQGVQLTHKQLWAALERNGVSVIDPKGEPFNPELHEAVSTLESAELPPNHVLTVMQKGYRLHDRLLRPAMVVVSRAVPTA